MDVTSVLRHGQHLACVASNTSHFSTPATFLGNLLLPLRLPENVDLLINVNDWNCVPSNPPALSSHGVPIDKQGNL